MQYSKVTQYIVGQVRNFGFLLKESQNKITDVSGMGVSGCRLGVCGGVEWVLSTLGRSLFDFWHCGRLMNRIFFALIYSYLKSGHYRKRGVKYPPPPYQSCIQLMLIRVGRCHLKEQTAFGDVLFGWPQTEVICTRGETSDIFKFFFSKYKNLCMSFKLLRIFYNNNSFVSRKILSFLLNFKLYNYLDSFLLCAFNSYCFFFPR